MYHNCNFDVWLKEYQENYKKRTHSWLAHDHETTKAVCDAFIDCGDDTVKFVTFHQMGLSDQYYAV